MAYKVRRQGKFETLTKAGFVPFEARTLSRLKLNLPYMKPLIKERQAEYAKMVKRSIKKGLSKADQDKAWLTYIKKRYIAHGWYKGKELWGVTVAFRMLKSKERAYKYKVPAYESPYETRNKAARFKGFKTKLDATFEKYPAGTAYHKRSRTSKPLPGRVVRNPDTGRFEVQYD